MSRAYPYVYFWLTDNIEDNTNTIETQENIEFVDNVAHDQEAMMQSSDPLGHHATTSDTNESILMRPVRIAQFAMNNGVSLFEKFDPWSLLMRNRLISNRLNHFKHFHGTLCLKFMINGNQFHSGLAWAIYNPLPSYDEVTQLRSGRLIDLIEGSQRPKIAMNPNGSVGGTLKLPFVFDKNAIDLTLNEESLLGTVVLVSVNTLQQANGGNKPAHITVMAWFEDTEISTPTAHQYVGLQNQINQNENGIVSGLAHSVANVTGKLSNVPVIGKGMQTASAVANAAGSIAQLFGFSKPTDLKLNRSVMSTNSCAATSEGQSFSKPLALSPLKGASIDPTDMWAASNDEMAIVPIAMKESYIDTFTWSSSAGIDNHLFSIRCGPAQAQFESVFGTLNVDWHVTPSTHVSLPFKWWTGSTKIRLEIIAAKVHEGRLRVVWDPIFTREPEEYNMNYSAIIDIGNTKDLTFDIGWGQNVNYLPCIENMSDAQTTSTSPIISRSPYYNGVLSVYVVQPLVIPTDDEEQNISVNVYQSMCDDFEVAEPRNLIARSIAPTVNVSQQPLTVDAPPGPDDNRVAPTASNPNNPTLNLLNEPLPNLTNRFYYIFRPSEVLSSSLGLFQSPCFDGLDPQFSDDWAISRLSTFEINGDLMRFNANDDVSFPVRAFVTGDTDYSIQNAAVQFSGTLTGVSDTDTIAFNQVNGIFNDAGPFSLNASNRLYLGPVTTTQTATLQFGAGPGTALLLSSIVTVRDLPAISFTPGAILNFEEPAVNADQSLLDRGGVLIDINLPGDTIPRGYIVLDYRLSGGNAYVEARRDDTLVEKLVMKENTTRGYMSVSSTARTIRIFVENNQTFTLDKVLWRGFDLASKNLAIQNQSDIDSQTYHRFGPPAAKSTNSVYFGEQVASIRQVLKREQTAFIFLGDTLGRTRNLILPHYPVNYRDLVPPIQFGELTQQNHLLEYFSRAYIAMKGGMRIKVVGAGRANAPSAFNVIARRVDITEDISNYDFNDVAPLEFGGGEYECTTVTGTLDVELPWYRNTRFAFARSSASQDQHDTWYHFSGPLTSSAAWLFNYSIAEDFTLCHWLSTPILREI